MRNTAKLDKLERRARVGQFDLTVKAISRVMDECAAEAMGGGLAGEKETLLDILESAHEKRD